MVFPTDPNLIVGLDRADDAGVYKVTDQIAMIQTVDFFTPIVDDPYQFGQIAAANSLSDVYAMGGVPKTAMNLVCFPLKEMDISILREIMRGGIDKMKEAGVVIVGGHSVEDKELKFGFSVTGFIHPDRILTKRNLKMGDDLILTKPIGTGIINTAIKAGIAAKDAIDSVTALMASLNKTAAEVMLEYPVHACTDITGFGLLGHIAEMVAGSGLGVEIQSKNVPLIPNVYTYASMGFMPGGLYKNKQFRESITLFSPQMDDLLQNILFDPQTSGGLLIGVDRPKAQELVDKLRKNGMESASVIGEVVSEHEGKIVVK